MNNAKEQTPDQENEQVRERIKQKLAEYDKQLESAYKVIQQSENSEARETAKKFAYSIARAKTDFLKNTEHLLDICLENPRANQTVLTLNKSQCQILVHALQNALQDVQRTIDIAIDEEEPDSILDDLKAEKREIQDLLAAL